MTARLSALLIFMATLAGIAEAPRCARADEAVAAAEESSSIVVLCAAGDTLGGRIVAELESLGFRPVILDPPAEPASRVSLERAARGAGAIAAIRAVPSERGVEVWIADRVTGKTVLRDLPNDGGTPDRDAALALRVVELLRASLLEVALPAAPRGEVRVTRAIRAKMDVPSAPLSDEQAPTLRFSLAPGVLLSPGGFGAAASLNVGIDWMPSEHAGLVGLASIPLTGSRIENAQGSADLAVVFVGAASRFVFPDRESVWSATMDLGVLALSLRAVGSTDPSFVAMRPSAVTAAPFARFGLAFVVTPTFRLRADVLAGTVAQGVALQFTNQTVGTWGQPLVLSSVGIDFGWF